ncbi:MAG: TonB-dependent receptor [Casimicrobiaceae bacterium]|nr:TonB-dependent receptor [Casimicrobiaceae bacterium]
MATCLFVPTSQPTPSPALKRRRLAAAVAVSLVALATQAQESPATLRTEPVTLTGKTTPVLEAEAADVGGFSAPLERTPQSVSVLSRDLLELTGSRTLSAAARLDGALADSYNAVGYLENLVVRGFELRSLGNYRRAGLPWQPLSPLATESLERVEVLKGVAGLQTGVAAPGGLVHFVPKRPLAGRTGEATLELTEHGNRRLHLDGNELFGATAVRVNLAAEGLDPPVDRAEGRRALVHAALRHRVSPKTTLELEAEWLRHRQPSVPGFGLLDADGDGVGETLPRLARTRSPGASVLTPRDNLNAQAWSLPMLYENTLLGGQWTQALEGGWTLRLAAREQRNRLDDRVAFPDGCSAGAVPVYPGWCADGSVDLYDYRSENERRRLRSALAEARGTLSLPGLPTQLTVGVEHWAARARLEPFQAYNFAGTINAFRPTPVPAAPDKGDRNTNSDERATSLSVRGESRLDALSSTLFWGANATWLLRASARSDGRRAVRLEQQLTTPWLGLAHEFLSVPGLMGYLSWGEGVEAEVVPNRPSLYANAGSVLPAARSRQWEAGMKWRLGPRLAATLAAFDLRKPSAEDAPASAERLLRVANARLQRHRGIEFGLSGRIESHTSVHLSATVLEAEVVRSLDPQRLGMRAPNVPRLKLAAFAHHRFASLPELSIDALLTHESGKPVEAPGSPRLPALTRLDLGATYRWSHTLGTSELRVAVSNLFDRVGWREAPATYWGGVYLFPTSPRTLRISLTHRW